MTFCVCSELDLAIPVCCRMLVHSRCTMHNHAFFKSTTLSSTPPIAIRYTVLANAVPCEDEFYGPHAPSIEFR
jgi:hypothetical protein